MSSLLALALAVAMIMPFSPVGAWFGFQVPPLEVVCSVGLIVVGYLVCAELLKRLAIGHVLLGNGGAQGSRGDGSGVDTLHRRQGVDPDQNVRWSKGTRRHLDRPPTSAAFDQITKCCT